MRLICPNCTTQYEVDASAIPAGGRDVQCGSCSTTWFQAPEQTNLPPKSDRSGLPMWPQDAQVPTPPPDLPGDVPQIDTAPNDQIISEPDAEELIGGPDTPPQPSRPTPSQSAQPEPDAARQPQPVTPPPATQATPDPAPDLQPVSPEMQADVAESSAPLEDESVYEADLRDEPSAEDLADLAALDAAPKPVESTNSSGTTDAPEGRDIDRVVASIGGTVAAAAALATATGTSDAAPAPAAMASGSDTDGQDEDTASGSDDESTATGSDDDTPTIAELFERARAAEAVQEQPVAAPDITLGAGLTRTAIEPNKQTPEPAAEPPVTGATTPAAPVRPEPALREEESLAQAIKKATEAKALAIAEQEAANLAQETAAPEPVALTPNPRPEAADTQSAPLTPAADAGTPPPLESVELQPEHPEAAPEVTMPPEPQIAQTDDAASLSLAVEALQRDVDETLPETSASDAIAQTGSDSVETVYDSAADAVHDLTADASTFVDAGELDADITEAPDTDVSDLVKAALQETTGPDAETPFPADERDAVPMPQDYEAEKLSDYDAVATYEDDAPEQGPADDDTQSDILRNHVRAAINEAAEAPAPVSTEPLAAAAASADAGDDSLAAKLKARVAEAARAQQLNPPPELSSGAILGTTAAGIAAAAGQTVTDFPRRGTEELSSSLRPKSLERSGLRPSLRPAATPEPQRSGFRLGLGIALMIVLLLLLVYIFRGQISDAVPALAGPLDTYGSFLDRLRTVFQGRPE